MIFADKTVLITGANRGIGRSLDWMPCGGAPSGSTPAPASP
jgi:hypothetical protein